MYKNAVFCCPYFYHISIDIYQFRLQVDCLVYPDRIIASHATHFSNCSKPPYHQDSRGQAPAKSRILASYIILCIVPGHHFTMIDKDMIKVPRDILLCLSISIIISFFNGFHQISFSYVLLTQQTNVEASLRMQSQLIQH